jgi:sec-independent protein translocase protein TatC
MAEETSLTFTGHLRELRRRLVYCAIGVAITTGLSFFFVGEIFDFFRSRAPDEVDIVYIGVTEMLTTYIKLAIYCGVALALPFLVYQAMKFIAPALTRRERSYMTLLLLGVAVSFVSGVAFTYFILLPPALNFLLSFGNDIAEPMISIGSYVSVLSRLLFWIGVVFNIPVVLYFLSRMGIVSPGWLLNKWKWAVILAFTLGAVITPTMDPLNQTLVAAPIVVLYFLGIALAWLARVGRERRHPVPTTAKEE